MPTATAVIHVIGLVLMSYQLVPGTGWWGVAPRIPCPHSRSDQQDVPLNALPADAAMNQTQVEEHAAVLLIPINDYVSSSNWAPTVLENHQPTSLYVKLDGERIRFITNVRTTVPTERTEIMPSRSSTDLGLTHQCCDLRKEYTPEDGSLAAALVDFSNGVPKVCSQDVPEQAVQMRRRDTNVYIANGGTLIIEATTKENVKKRITVRGNTQLVLANIPSKLIPGSSQCSVNGVLMHEVAYGAMLKACPRDAQCPSGDLPVVPSCGDKTFGVVARQSQYDHITDARCSNNQWP